MRRYYTVNSHMIAIIKSSLQCLVIQYQSICYIHIAASIQPFIVIHEATQASNILSNIKIKRTDYNISTHTHTHTHTPHAHTHARTHARTHDRTHTHTHTHSHTTHTHSHTTHTHSLANKEWESKKTKDKRNRKKRKRTYILASLRLPHVSALCTCA